LAGVGNGGQVDGRIGREFLGTLLAAIDTVGRGGLEGDYGFVIEGLGTGGGGAVDAGGNTGNAQPLRRADGERPDFGESDSDILVGVHQHGASLRVPAISVTRPLQHSKPLIGDGCQSDVGTEFKGRVAVKPIRSPTLHALRLAGDDTFVLGGHVDSENATRGLEQGAHGLAAIDRERAGRFETAADTLPAAEAIPCIRRGGQCHLVAIFKVRLANASAGAAIEAAQITRNGALDRYGIDENRGTRRGGLEGDRIRPIAGLVVANGDENLVFSGIQPIEGLADLAARSIAQGIADIGQPLGEQGVALAKENGVVTRGLGSGIPALVQGKSGNHGGTLALIGFDGNRQVTRLVEGHQAKIHLVPPAISRGSDEIETAGQVVGLFAGLAFR